MTAHDSTKPAWLWGPYSPLGLGIALIAGLLDQVHKWWMLFVYDITSRAPVEITWFLNLVYVSNKGISFGMLQQGSDGQVLFAAFSAVVALGLAIWLARSSDSRLMAASIGLIIGGAIGNAIDRLHLGGVADFFDFDLYGYHWPAFNIADAAIVAGVIGLLYDSFIPSRKGAANRA